MWISKTLSSHAVHMKRTSNWSFSLNLLTLNFWLELSFMIANPKQFAKTNLTICSKSTHTHTARARHTARSFLHCKEMLLIVQFNQRDKPLMRAELAFVLAVELHIENKRETNKQMGMPLLRGLMSWDAEPFALFLLIRNAGRERNRKIRIITQCPFRWDHFRLENIENVPFINGMESIKFRSAAHIHCDSHRLLFVCTISIFSMYRMNAMLNEFKVYRSNDWVYHKTANERCFANPMQC